MSNSDPLVNRQPAAEGNAVARHYQTGQLLRVRWNQDHIAELSPLADQPGVQTWMAPALVDLQVNGYGGVDFQGAVPSAGTLLQAARALARAGCTRFLLTLITAPWPQLLDRLRQFRQQRTELAELGHAIAGWHLEGPFLSTEPGYHGAHQPDCMMPPEPSQLRQLREVTRTDPVLLTLAPEVPGAIAAIELAVALGFRVSLGHTNASADQLRAAITAGASGFTHLGNACPQQLDRHDNILWRVLDQIPAPASATSLMPPNRSRDFRVTLIPDGHHVSPALFRLFHRVLGDDRICYVSDAMAAAGAPPGRYRLANLELEVGPDRIVRQPGQTNFAGSSLEPLRGVLRAAEMLGASWRQVWDAFSVRPAEWLGLPTGLEVGAPADFCLLEGAPNELPGRVDTYVRGRLSAQAVNGVTGG